MPLLQARDQDLTSGQHLINYQNSRHQFSLFKQFRSLSFEIQDAGPKSSLYDYQVPIRFATMPSTDTRSTAVVSRKKTDAGRRKPLADEQSKRFSQVRGQKDSAPQAMPV